MKSNQKRSWLASTMAACVLVGALAVGGTMAYLTDSESATNTFTVGKVDVALTEPNYPGNDSPDVKDLVPNQEVQKDPKVTNVGVNDAIVFMSVEVPVKDVTLVKADGTKGAKEKTELFWLKDTTDTQGIYANHFSDQWMELTSKGEKDLTAGNTNTYVFAYKTAVAKDAATDSLFDKIQLKNVIENEVTAGEAQNVVVNTYAIQASEVLEGNTDLTDALTEENLGKIYDIYFNQNPEKGSDSEDKPEIKQGTATLIEGPSFNEAMKTLSGNLDKIQSIKNADSVPEDAETQIISDSGSEKEAVMYFDAATGTIYIATDAEKIRLNKESNDMFSDCDSLTDINALSGCDTGNVTDMNNMFNSCGSLTDLSALSGWDTGNVTDMNNMFFSCSSLTNLSALSGWDTGNVTDMTGMFRQCTFLADLSALSGWDTGNVTDMGEMFSRCTFLIDLSSLSGWDTGNVTDMNNMFSNCTSLTDLTALSGWDTGNVMIMTSMFSNCTSLTDLTALSGWNTRRVEGMGEMFLNCRSLTDLNALSGWNTGNVMIMASMFSSCNSLTDISALSGWDTGGVMDMNNMFNSCGSLTDLSALSGWDTGRVAYMSEMFSRCTSLTNLTGLSGWDTGTVMDMSEMFYDCYCLTDASGINDWNIGKVSRFDYMFQRCPSHPEFAKRPGTWKSNGTFIPSN